MLAADNGSEDPSLLADRFEFCGPVVGPLPKPAFVAAWRSFGLREAMPDLEWNVRAAAALQPHVMQAATLCAEGCQL